jgi:ferrous iron transport protein A
MQTLKDAKIGSVVRVVKVHGEGALKRRIMDMGITKGVEIFLRKVAPFGDPLQLNLRGYELTLRKADAANIEVTYTTEQGAQA